MVGDTVALWGINCGLRLNYENTVDPVITQVNKKVLLKNNTQRLQNLRECLAKEATSEDIH